ncbi:hypothetical protein [Hoeflea sp.]|uniref:hypothetical protein n=1 Tax=Hoeflea sp. TaxID=1940281 RepID=UPI0037486486
MSEKCGLIFLLGSPVHSVLDVAALLPMALCTRNDMTGFREISSSYAERHFPEILIGSDGNFNGAVTSAVPSGANVVKSDWHETDNMLRGDIRLRRQGEATLEMETIVRLLSHADFKQGSDETFEDQLATIIEDTKTRLGKEEITHICFVGVLHASSSYNRPSTDTERLLAWFLSAGEAMAATYKEQSVRTALGISGIERLIAEVKEYQDLEGNPVTTARFLHNRDAVRNLLMNCVEPLAHVNSAIWECASHDDSRGFICPLLPCGLDRAGQTNWNQSTGTFTYPLSVKQADSTATPDIIPFGIREMIMGMLLDEEGENLLPFDEYANEVLGRRPIPGSRNGAGRQA